MKERVFKLYCCYGVAVKMEERVLFNKGMQRKFLDEVRTSLSSPSLHGILQFGFKTNYSSLKNYYNERRLLPKDLFLGLCELSKIDVNTIKIKYIKGNWGQVKGGKKSKK